MFSCAPTRARYSQSLLSVFAKSLLFDLDLVGLSQILRHTDKHSNEHSQVVEHLRPHVVSSVACGKAGRARPPRRTAGRGPKG